MSPLGNPRNRQWILKSALVLAATALLGHIGYSTLYYLHNWEFSQLPAFSSGFEDGNVSAWEQRGEVEFCCSHSRAFVTQAARNGGQALRITLRKDDPLVSGGKRAELRLEAVSPRDDQWYAFSLLLPADEQSTSDIATVAQWHAVDDKILGEGGRAPPLRLIVQDDTWRIVTTWDSRFLSGIPLLRSEPQGGKVLWTAPADRGAWADWVFHVKWSYGEDGIVQVWKDGVAVVQYNGPNAYNDLIGPFFKIGVYVPAWKMQDTHLSKQQMSIVVDDVRQSSAPLPIENQGTPAPESRASASSDAHRSEASPRAEPAGHSASARTP